MPQQRHNSGTRALSRVMLVVITALFAAFSSAAQAAYYVDKGAPLAYHAYFRKVAPPDPGTLHLFIGNSAAQALKVERIWLNG